MRIALAGRPGAGKTTLLDLLAGTEEVGTAGGLRIAHIPVPDPRLDDLSLAFKPRKTTPARLEFQDLEQKAGPVYPALSPDRRAMLTRADLILLVVALYEEDPSDWTESARRQLQEAEDEFCLLDLATVEGRLEKLGKLLKIGQKPAFVGEPEILERIRVPLSSGQPIAAHDWSEDEARSLRGFGFLSARRILPAWNVDEEHTHRIQDMLAGAGGGQASESRPDSGPRVIFSAQVERQIQELPPDERGGFLEAFGLATPAVEQVIRAAYEAAGLHCFFTVGEDEVRAWSVRRGAKAPEAAGIIHSDLEKGFVRAEVLSYEDWRRFGSLAKAREHGSLRMEGREFEIRDGDIVNIRSGLAKSRG